MSWIHVYVYVQVSDSLSSVFSAACVLVENEVFIRKIAYTQENLPHRIPTDAETSHGFSFVLSWLSFVAYVIAGAIFLFTSHKRKADMADEFDECIEEDDPVVIRRWRNHQTQYPLNLMARIKLLWLVKWCHDTFPNYNLRKIPWLYLPVRKYPLTACVFRKISSRSQLAVTMRDRNIPLGVKLWGWWNIKEKKRRGDLPYPEWHFIYFLICNCCL